MQYFTVVNNSGKTIRIEEHVVPAGTAVVVTSSPDLVDLVDGVDVYIVVNQVESQVPLAVSHPNPRKSFTRVSDKVTPDPVPEKPVNIEDLLGDVGSAKSSVSAEVTEASVPSVQKTREVLGRKRPKSSDEV